MLEQIQKSKTQGWIYIELTNTFLNINGEETYIINEFSFVFEKYTKFNFDEK